MKSKLIDKMDRGEVLELVTEFEIVGFEYSALINGVHIETYPSFSVQVQRNDETESFRYSVLYKFED